MKVLLDLDPEGLGEALAELMPMGIRPRSVRLTAGGLRAVMKAPMLGEVTLVAKVLNQPGELVLFDFDLEGAGIAKALALGKIREKIADVDRVKGPFRVWGETDGERLRVSWKK